MSDHRVLQFLIYWMLEYLMEVTSLGVLRLFLSEVVEQSRRDEDEGGDEEGAGESFAADFSQGSHGSE